MSDPKPSTTSAPIAPDSLSQDPGELASPQPQEPPAPYEATPNSDHQESSIAPETAPVETPEPAAETLSPAVEAWVQLIRLPNTLSAGADSLAGWLIITGTLASPLQWIPLVLASMAVYAAGIILNDLVDYEEDLQDRPERPLPSGRVPMKVIRPTILGLLVLAGILATLGTGSSGLFVVAMLTGCVAGYNILAKRTLAGPLVMGACRGFNLALGFSVVPNLGGPWAWSLALGYGLFVTGLTGIARREVEGGRSIWLGLGIASENLALLVLAVVAAIGQFAQPGDGLLNGLVVQATASPPEILLGAFVLAIVAWFNNQATRKAWDEPNPDHLQSAVKSGLLTLIWILFGTVMMIRGLAPAGASVLIFWVPSIFLTLRKKVDLT